MLSSLYEKGCLFVNQYFSWVFKSIDLEWDEKLEDALDFLHIDLKPREIMIFAWFSGLAVLIITFFFTLVAMLMGANSLYVLLIGFILAIGVIFFIPDYPVRLVNYERIRCLSYAPRLVAYMIIPLKQDPNIEKAVKFAAECGDDKLSEDLKQLLWHTWSGKHNSVDDALPELGLRWGAHIKGFRDALYAIRSSQLEKHETRRLDTLDRALRELLSNIQAEFKDFTNELRVPTSFLFMGGVLLPMVALMFLPVLSMMGLEIGAPIYVIIGLSIIVVAVFVVAGLCLQGNSN
jgi:Ca2+/Na+ antiporter